VGCSVGLDERGKSRPTVIRRPDRPTSIKSLYSAIPSSIIYTVNINVNVKNNNLFASKKRAT